MDTVRRKERRASVRRKEFKGSAVVEMSYIIPLFLGLFVLLVHAVFYYHDKAVLTGAAQETAILGAQAARRPETEYDLEAFFRERIEGKLIYMTEPELSVEESRDRVQAAASAGKGIMKLAVCQKAEIVRPEEDLRRMGVVR